MPRAATWPIAILCCLAIGPLGCGKADPRVGVSGSVTLGGIPLDQGIVEFHGAAAEGPAGGAAIVAGRYEVPRAHGLLPGTYRVVVLSSGEQISGPGVPDPFATEPPAGKPKAPGLIRFRDRIPPEFGSESTLETTLAPGQANTFDIAIPTRARPRP
jgi:hypothetical protein